MGTQSKEQLKEWFLRGLKPTENQFHDWMDSYWHKSEEIPAILELEDKINSIQPNVVPILENQEDYDKFILCVGILDGNGKINIYAPNTNAELTFLQNTATVFDDINIESISVSFIFSREMNTEISTVLFRKLTNAISDILNGTWMDNKTLQVNFPTTGNNILINGNRFQFNLSDLQDINNKSIANFDWMQTFLLVLGPTRVFNFLNTRTRRTSQMHNGNLYIPTTSANIIEIFDLETETVREISLPNATSRSTSQIYNGKLYMPSSGGSFIEIFDLETETVRAVSIPGFGRITSQVYNGKLYMPQYGGVNLLMFDLETETTRMIALPNSINRETSQIYNGKLYMISKSSNIIEIFDLETEIVRTINPFINTQSCRTSQLYNGKIYIPVESQSNIYSVFDLETEAIRDISLPKIMNRRTSIAVNNKMYIPQSGGTSIEIFDFETETAKYVVQLTNAVTRYACNQYNGKLYSLSDANIMEITLL